MDIYQQKSKPDYHRLRTMAKRSIEPEFRTRNFEAQNGRIESNSLVKNQGTKDGRDCWRLQASGKFLKGNNCSFHHYSNKREKLRHSLLFFSKMNHAIKKCEEFREIQEALGEKSVWENLVYCARNIFEKLVLVSTS